MKPVMNVSFDKSILSGEPENAGYSTSPFTMPFMQVPMSWYNAEFFPIESFRGVAAYICFSGMASGIMKKPENRL